MNSAGIFDWGLCSPTLLCWCRQGTIVVRWPGGPGGGLAQSLVTVGVAFFVGEISLGSSPDCIVPVQQLQCRFSAHRYLPLCKPTFIFGGHFSLLCAMAPANGSSKSRKANTAAAPASKAAPKKPVVPALPLKRHAATPSASSVANSTSVPKADKKIAQPNAKDQQPAKNGDAAGIEQTPASRAQSKVTSALMDKRVDSQDKSQGKSAWGINLLHKSPNHRVLGAVMLT